MRRRRARRSGRARWGCRGRMAAMGGAAHARTGGRGGWAQRWVASPASRVAEVASGVMRASLGRRVARNAQDPRGEQVIERAVLLLAAVSAPPAEPVPPGLLQPLLLRRRRFVTRLCAHARPERGGSIH